MPGCSHDICGFCLFSLFPEETVAERLCVSPAAQAVNKFLDSGAAAKSAGPSETDRQGAGEAMDLGGASRGVGGAASVMPPPAKGLREAWGSDPRGAGPRAHRGHARPGLEGVWGEPGPERTAGSELLCPELGAGISQDLRSRGTAQWEPLTGAGSADMAGGKAAKGIPGQALGQEGMQRHHLQD